MTDTRIDIVARVNAGLAALGIPADADPDGVREVCGPPTLAGACDLWGCTTVRLCLDHAALLLDKHADMAAAGMLRRIESKDLQS